MLYGLPVDSPSIFLKLIARFIESIGAVQDFCGFHSLHPQARTTSMKQKRRRGKAARPIRLRPSENIKTVFQTAF